MEPADPASTGTQHGLRRRLAWLLASVGAGLLVGGIGRAMTGEDAWFLAVPGFMALAWLFIANPSECERGCAPGSHPRSDE